MPEALGAAVAVPPDPLPLSAAVLLVVAAEAPTEPLGAAVVELEPLAPAAAVVLVLALVSVVSLESLDAAATEDLAAAETLLRNSSRLC